MKTLFILLFAFALGLPAHASPGAHGPNGEHLDGPATAPAGGSLPRVETFSELFELAGSLSGGELSIMIDRYDSNEPVLEGKLEVQYKQLKAQATYHADIGDYAVDDPAFLAALARPGKHALLFTFAANGESDLLEGTLEVPPVAPPAAPGWKRWWPAGALLAAVAAVAAALRIRRLLGGRP